MIHDHDVFPKDCASAIETFCKLFIDKPPGHTAAASYVLAPTILESPAPLLARQWRKGFDIAKLVTGPLSLACGVTFGALAYRGMSEFF